MKQFYLQMTSRIWLWQEARVIACMKGNYQFCHLQKLPGEIFVIYNKNIIKTMFLSYSARRFYIRIDNTPPPSRLHWQGDERQQVAWQNSYKNNEAGWVHHGHWTLVHEFVPMTYHETATILVCSMKLPQACFNDAHLECTMYYNKANAVGTLSNTRTYSEYLTNATGHLNRTLWLNSGHI